MFLKNVRILISHVNVYKTNNITILINNCFKLLKILFWVKEFLGMKEFFLGMKEFVGGLIICPFCITYISFIKC